MHDVTDIEGKYPVISTIVLDAKGTSSCDLKLLLYLEFVHLFKCLERDFELLFLSHSVLEVVSSIFEVKLADLTELLLYAYQLVNYDMRVIYLLLEDFDFVRYIVAAASIGGR